MSIILGIDPGLRITGFGIIRQQGNRLYYAGSGCIRTNGKQLPERLQQIFQGISEVIAEYQPHQVAIEQVFIAKNAASALKLGQARGSAIVAASHAALPVAEYSARQIKLAVVGTGKAEKQQIQHMVCRMLNLPDVPQTDVADGLAIALCHIHAQQSLLHLAGQATKISRGRLR